MGIIQSKYDIAIIGGGHNGLVSACYLAKAGLSVLVLERNETLGGATQSTQIFEGLDARISAFSYLVSLFPDKIISDLGLNLKLRSRKTASWTPSIANGNFRELLIHQNNDAANREAFREFTGNDREYQGYLDLQKMQEQVAEVIWPSLTQPLKTREEMRDQIDSDAWQALIEEPLGNVIEHKLKDDLIRGLVFTDGRIGLSTFPHDPSLLQNRSFLYHVIGRGTGEWSVPVGGMGALVQELIRVAAATGRVTFKTGAKVSAIHPNKSLSSVVFEENEFPREIDARFVLCNASADVLEDLTHTNSHQNTPVHEGAGFKINMLLKKLPELRSDRCSPREAFAGTVHIDEGYEQMQHSYEESLDGKIPSRPPGEIYCHTLTDDSILSEDLNKQGYQTLTLFGLDMPYRLFEKDNAHARVQATDSYLEGINQYLREPIESCLATDANGAPCIEAMSPFDLEKKIHLPKGNIFHGDLSWPFTDDNDEAGQWGIETRHTNIFLCGSAAKRGGAVSGIPGHNAAMKVLKTLRIV